MDWGGFAVGLGSALALGALGFAARRLTASLDHDSRIRANEASLGRKADGEHVTAMMGELSARLAALESRVPDLARAVGRIEGRAGRNGDDP